MWVLLSGGLRRWVVFSLAVPLASRLLGSAGQRLEARNGATGLSRGLQTAGRLAATRGRPSAQGPASAPKRRRSLFGARG